MSERDVLRAVLANSPVPAVTLDGAIDAERAAGVRAAVAAAGLEGYWVADRGRYAQNSTYRDNALFALMRAIVSEIIGAPLQQPVRAVWMKLVHGDYVLTKDDHFVSRPLPPHVDATLDLSAERLTGEAQVVYMSAAGQLVAEHVPGRLIIADRRRVGFVRWDRYLTQNVKDASAWRLRLAFP